MGVKPNEDEDVKLLWMKKMGINAENPVLTKTAKKKE